VATSSLGRIRLFDDARAAQLGVVHPSLGSFLGLPSTLQCLRAVCCRRRRLPTDASPIAATRMRESLLQQRDHLSCQAVHHRVNTECRPSRKVGAGSNTYATTTRSTVTAARTAFQQVRARAGSGPTWPRDRRTCAMHGGERPRTRPAITLVVWRCVGDLLSCGGSSSGHLQSQTGTGPGTSRATGSRTGTGAGAGTSTGTGTGTGTYHRYRRQSCASRHRRWTRWRQMFLAAPNARSAPLHCCYNGRRHSRW